MSQLARSLAFLPLSLLPYPFPSLFVPLSVLLPFLLFCGSSQFTPLPAPPSSTPNPPSLPLAPSAHLFSSGFCGFMSIISSMRYCLGPPEAYNAMWAALAFMPFGLFFDFMDGKVARWRHKSSLMGQELDSLADLVGETLLFSFSYTLSSSSFPHPSLLPFPSSPLPSSSLFPTPSILPHLPTHNPHPHRYPSASLLPSPPSRSAYVPRSTLSSSPSSSSAA